MQPTFLGKISAPSANAPVQILSDQSVRACRIVVATIPGLSGSIFIGGANLNTSTLAGVLIEFNPPGTVGPAGVLAIDARSPSNSLRVSDYWLAASVAGEGALVTYFQI
jgi:hypothetical protein